MTTNNWQQFDIRLYAVLISLLVSVFSILVPEVPNRDAYTYIRTAEIFLSDGTAAAFQHYSWASYSLLIAVVSKLGLSLFTAAYVVNALLSALLVYSFISLVRLFDDTRIVLLLAALCIIIYPQLNEYRYMIVRDIGFWAFSLFALWQFMLYSRFPAYSNAIAFCIALLVAASFRVEALAYLAIVPFSLLLDERHEPQRRKIHLLKTFSVIGAILILALVLLAIAGMNIVGLFLEFVSVYEPFVNNVSTILNPDEGTVSEVGRAIFGDYASAYSQEYIALFIAAGMLVILVANLFIGIGGPYFWLLAFGFFKKYVHVERNTAMPIIFFAITNLLILFTFLYTTRYLTSRYAMLFCLLLVLLVPFIVAATLERAKQSQRQRMCWSFFILFFTYCAIDSFYSFGERKEFLADSSTWIETNATPSTSLVTNNMAIAYSTGMVEDYDRTERFLKEADIIAARPGDLIAIEMYYEMKELVEQDSVRKLLSLQAAFPSMEEQTLVIYQRKTP